VSLSALDLAVFFVFIAAVVLLSLIKSRKEKDAEDFFLAALAGAVISSLASMLNSASTIFTMDLYKRHWRKGASQRSLMLIGRIMTVLFVLIACFIAPRLADPKFGGVFRYIQEFQGYISPGIVAAFVFGFIIKKAPPAAAVAPGPLAGRDGHRTCHSRPKYSKKDPLISRMRTGETLLC
jgi:uncharacterized sodium:solute symporter family permease YidK